MPRIVDHDERRHQVVKVARQLLLSDGLDGMSVRAIARATGFSTAIVSHYFHNKAELMLLIFQETLAISLKRFHRAIEADLPLAQCLQSLIPLDEDNRDVWRTWFAFWNMTISDPGFRAVQVERSEILLSTLERLIRGEMARRSIDLPDAATEARRLFASIIGISIQAVHDPQSWPSERQCAMLETEIEAVFTYPS